MGIQAKLSKVAVVLFCLAILPAGTAGARGLAPAFTAMPHHLRVPVRHRCSRTSNRRATNSRHLRIIQYPGKNQSKRIRHVSASHKSRRRHFRHVASSRHAYPLNFFMLSAPDLNLSPLPVEISGKIQQDFQAGDAAVHSCQALVRAGVIVRHPMHGGIFWRRQPVKYIIVHSTETGRPIGATRVIDAWSSLGRRHAGAQYVVDRDGLIYEAADPDLATVHVNIFKTIEGINNDNSIGIEMVHAGSQTYTPEQKLSMVRLVTYLQDRYEVNEGNIITHRYAQRGDHTDPVAFDWQGFLIEQKQFHMQTVSRRMEALNEEIARLTPGSGLEATVYMQPHGKLKPAAAGSSRFDDKQAQAAAAARRRQPVNIPIEQVEQVEQAGKLDKAATTLLPALRGPIEMDPQTATIFNTSSPDLSPPGSNN